MDNTTTQTPKKKSRKSKAQPSYSGPRCAICGLYQQQTKGPDREQECVGHLGVHESFLSFPNGIAVPVPE